jgi:hypothetical protein
MRDHQEIAKILAKCIEGNFEPAGPDVKFVATDNYVSRIASAIKKTQQEYYVAGHKDGIAKQYTIDLMCLGMAVEIGEDGTTKRINQLATSEVKLKSTEKGEKE